MLNNTDFTIIVTKISNKYHARLYQTDNILDEMACSLKEDIGWISREMLRWQDKLGNANHQTHSARIRQTLPPKGKVYTKIQLERKP